MASWLDRHWEPTPDAPARRNQRGGLYQAYQPDELCSRPVVLEPELAARAAEVERAVRRLPLGPEAAGLEGLARFLLRSEAIASSRIEGLQVRYTGSPLDRPALDGLTRWIGLFLDATTVAAEQAARFAAELADLRAGWHERLAAWRADRGVRERPRSGSAAARLVELLPEVPVMTTGTIQRLLELSFPSARAAVEELADAGVVARRRVEGGTTGYLATEVLDLLTYAERRLTSTRWDPRQSKPVRAVPPRPQRRPV